MGNGTARAHLGSHPDRFHDLLGGSALFQCGLGMTADTVGTLRDMSHGHGNQLLGSSRQGAIGEHLAAELTECLVNFRGQFAALATESGVACGNSASSGMVTFLVPNEYPYGYDKYFSYILQTTKNQYYYDYLLCLKRCNRF